MLHVMRVLVISKDFPAPGLPEDGIVTLRQARALADLGHEILVARVVPLAPPVTRKWSGYGSIPPVYSIEGIECRTLRALFPPRMIAMEYLPLQVGSALRRLAREFRADLVHAQCVIPSGQLAVDLGAPAVVTAHGSDAYDWAWRRPGLTRAARYGLQRAAAVVAVSNFIRDRVRALVDRRVDVIPNGADERVFFPSDPIAARGELGIARERFVVLFAGGPPKIKGAFDLIAAAALLRSLNPLLLFAGPQEYESQVLKASSDAQIDARFCGMLDHAALARTMAACDVFSLPSYREGLPLVLCEAMLSGRPIVATPVGGIPEILSDGVNGYLVPPGDVALLAERLRCIASARDEAVRMGRAGRAFAVERLTWASNARAYDSLFAAVTKAQTPPSPSPRVEALSTEETPRAFPSLRILGPSAFSSARPT